MPATGDRLVQEVKDDCNRRLEATEARLRSLENDAGLDVSAQLKGITERLDLHQQKLTLVLSCLKDIARIFGAFDEDT